MVGDPFPFGIEKNRKALEAITQFAFDQQMVPSKYSVEELFNAEFVGCDHGPESKRQADTFRGLRLRKVRTACAKLTDV